MSEQVKKELKTVILIEDTGSISAHEHAAALSAKTGFEVYEVNPQKKNHSFKEAQWQLVYTPLGLALRLSSEVQWSDIRVDFASSALKYRQQHGGGKNEAIAKAIGIRGKESLRIVDATAGMGTDSFVMASVGGSVLMIERSPVIAALLEDALYRLEQANEPIFKQLSLVQGDASELLSSINSDVIYLDPMFPHKKKSALVKKEMQAFQMLLGPDSDSEQLLSNALLSDAKRVVVKRPANAPELSNQQNKSPSAIIRSKKHRFDVYIK